MKQKPGGAVEEKKEAPGYGKGPMGIIRMLTETDLEKKNRFTKIFQFLFPWIFWLIMAVTTLSIMTIWKGWDTARNLMDIWIFYTVPPAGKETLIPLVVLDKQYPVPGLMAGLCTIIIDLCFSLFLIWNYDWVKRFPILGPAIERTEAKGRERVAKTKWFAKTTFALTTVFVFVPFSGSGGVGGTIFGRVVGMKPYKVLLAVAIGSTIGSTGFALAAEQLSNILSEDNVFLSFMSNLNILQVVLVLIVIGFIVYTIRNPRMAALRTTRVVSQALDLSEKAIRIGEEQRKKAAKATILGTRETMKALGEVNRTLVDIPVEVVIAPLRLMGDDGIRFADDTKEMTRMFVDDTQQVFGSAIDHTMEFGDKLTSLTMGSIQNLTIGGIEQTKKGWDSTGRIIIRGGERLEKVVKKKDDGKEKEKQ